MIDSQPLTAVVLAGGQGSRLMPHTAEIPKPLVPLDGRPIVEYMLDRLHRGGVRRVVMAVNHMADQIETALGDGSRYGLEISYSREERPLSTVAPLKLIEDLPERFIVANADVLTDLDIGHLYQVHVENRAMLTVATYQRTESIDYGVLVTDPDSRVVGFTEKPDYSFVVSMGIYVFSREVLQYVPENKPFGFDDLMFKLLAERLPVWSYPYDGYWLDIGRPSDYFRAQEEIERVKKLL